MQAVYIGAAPLFLALAMSVAESFKFLDFTLRFESRCSRGRGPFFFSFEIIDNLGGGHIPLPLSLVFILFYQSTHDERM